MGMNMITIGSEKAMEVIQRHFPDMTLLSLSGCFEMWDRVPYRISVTTDFHSSFQATSVLTRSHQL